MDTDSSIMTIKTISFFKDISNDIDKSFDTSNFDENDNRPLIIGKNKKVIGKFKIEVGSKIITPFYGLRAKTNAYKLHNDHEDKKAKGTKKCLVKRDNSFDKYVDILFNDKELLKSQFTFKIDHHTIYTQKVNKIALNYFDDKRIQANDKITTYPYSYFDNDTDINSEIKNNIDKLNEIDNRGIIPKNYNTKDPLKKENNANITLDINKIIDVNSDNYLDSTKSTCIDIIKSTNANSNYLDSTKSVCEDIRKSNNANIICVDSVKNTYSHIIKNTNVNSNYLDSAKSTYIDIIKSTNVDNNYLDSIKSTFADIIKNTNGKTNKIKK